MSNYNDQAIEQLAKFLTKNEVALGKVINLMVNTNRCPHMLELKDFDVCNNQCLECWKQALQPAL